MPDAFWKRIGQAFGRIAMGLGLPLLDAYPRRPTSMTTLCLEPQCRSLGTARYRSRQAGGGQAAAGYIPVRIMLLKLVRSDVRSDVAKVAVCKF